MSYMQEAVEFYKPILVLDKKLVLRVLSKQQSHLDPGSKSPNTG